MADAEQHPHWEAIYSPVEQAVYEFRELTGAWEEDGRGITEEVAIRAASAAAAALLKEYEKAKQPTRGERIARWSAEFVATVTVTILAIAVIGFLFNLAAWAWTGNWVFNK